MNATSVSSGLHWWSRPLALLCPLAWALACRAAPGPQVIDHVRLFDGHSVHDDARVILDGARIGQVGPATALPLPDRARVIDGRGMTLLPGLIDAHTHTWGAPDLARALAFGVTTELDMMARPDVIRRLRRSARETPGLADVRSAGNPVTVPHGHGTQYGLPVETLEPGEDASEFVADRIREGSDYVKLILEDFGGRAPTLTASQLRAAIQATHQQQLLAVVHATTAEHATTAVAAGADGLAHAWIGDTTPELIGHLVANDVFVVPTLTVLTSGCPASAGRRLLADERATRRLTAREERTLAAGLPPGPACVRAPALVGALHRAGVDLLAGTDAGNPGTAHGVSLHGELQLLVEAGLSPVAALSAATSVPARRFSLDDRGVIAEGRRADLLLVEGDPTVDITATLDIVAVWKAGVPSHLDTLR